MKGSFQILPTITISIMVCLSQLFNVNTILLTALFATAAAADDNGHYSPAIYYRYGILKREAGIESKLDKLHSGGVGRIGHPWTGLGPQLHKIYYAYDSNNVDMNTLGQDRDAEVTFEDYSNIFKKFTFSLPGRRDVKIDGYEQGEDINLYIAGGNGDVIGGCHKDDQEQPGSRVGKVLQCDVWNVPQQ